LPITNTTGPIKGCEDADLCIVIFKETKSSTWGWGPGSDDMGKKSLNLPLLWRKPQKAQVQNFPILLIKNRRLSASLECLKNSLAQSADMLRLEMSWTIHWLLWSLKGEW